MASSSSTPFTKKSFKYDVFLSFRGEDTRKSFVDHLYYALERKNIHTYKDDESMEKGRRISDELINSIQDSKCYIIVFSRNYAASSWCLDELVKIIECQKSNEQTAYPVFFDVEPSEVRQLTGKVGESFSKHEIEEATGKWREALKEAADLAGWELKNTFDGHEAKFIQKIVEEISLELRSINFSVDEKLVGMESRTKDIILSLETGFNDVGMIGIKGMGGGGKTTLARAVFNQISAQFEGKSFVENVREVSKASLSGLNSLQRQVLSDVSGKKEIKDIPISSVYDGKNSMKKIMSCKKVLIVLDDVDHIEQLEALAGAPEWFKPGSRIIITTRDEQVLIAHRVNSIHDVNLLSHEEAMRLFSRYAFGRDIPILGYEKLSSLVVCYAAGLPLTIRVLGSFLCGKIEPEWIDALERLKTIPLKETLEKLELSYNGLEDDYKEIFLDVACILKGWKKEKAIRALESCGFHARNGLRVLEQKSLITVNACHYLGMHDHIEEMGRNIVRRLHPNEPNKHSRLWVDEEIKDTLANSLGTRETRCIKLSTMEINPKIVMEGLGNMKELRFIGVFNDRNSKSHKNWKFDEVTQYFPNSLRCLHWRAYPFRCLPSTFQANSLGVLTMPYSSIRQLWEGGERKVLRKLRFLDLSYSKLRTLDLRQALNLEKVCLDRCVHLLELSMPDDCLKLISLSLSYTKLRTLNLGVTPNLETLNLEGCQDLIELHMNVRCPKVKYICLNNSKLEKLDLGLTPNIERLHLRECYNLLELHTPVGCLNKIVFLDLSGCLSFKSFLFLKLLDSPKVGPASELHLIAESIDICPLRSENNLPKFRFTCLYREDPASSYGNVEKLLSVGHCACTNLESFLRTICGLRHIRKLKLEGSIPEAPKDIEQLECLEELIISSKKIKHLPDGICMLKHLKSLELISCWYLEKLPEDLGRLECLEKLILSECIFLRDVPNSICKMKHLKHFMLSYCVLVERLPEELGCLKYLQELYLQGTGINHLPQSIVNLKGLRIFGSRWWLESYGFTSKIQTIFGTYYTVLQ